MSKKYKIIIVSIVLITIAGIIFFIRAQGRKPFNDLALDEIKSVSVELLPPNIKFELNDGEIKRFVEIIKGVVIYNRDDSYSEYYGQAAIYTITKKDGTSVKINAYNPFLIIDNKGYKTKYEPCEKLNSFANECLRIRE